MSWIEVVLSKEDLVELNKPIVGEGGFQDLLRRLQGYIVPNTNSVRIPIEELETLVRYAMSYGQGGWQGRLTSLVESIREITTTVLSGVGSPSSDERTE